MTEQQSLLLKPATPIDPIEAGVFDRITQSLLKREGFRHLWLGDSGMGKTVANDALIRWLLKHRKVDLVLTIDEKNSWEVQYRGGIERVNPAHLRTNPPGQLPTDADRDNRLVVFRGIAATRTPGPGVDNLIFDTAEMAWEVIRASPARVVLNIDELADASNGQHWKQDSVAATYRKGRAVGISILATTQLPQLLPREAFGLPETIGIFRMTSREAEYLAKYRVLPDSEVESIEKLGVGEWRLFQKSHALDPSIYRLSL